MPVNLFLQRMETILPFPSMRPLQNRTTATCSSENHLKVVKELKSLRKPCKCNKLCFCIFPIFLIGACIAFYVKWHVQFILLSRWCIGELGRGRGMGFHDWEPALLALGSWLLPMRIDYIHQKHFHSYTFNNICWINRLDDLHSFIASSLPKAVRLFVQHVQLATDIR